MSLYMSPWVCPCVLYFRHQVRIFFPSWTTSLSANRISVCFKARKYWNTSLKFGFKKPPTLLLLSCTYLIAEEHHASIKCVVIRNYPLSLAVLLTIVIPSFQICGGWNRAMLVSSRLSRFPHFGLLISQSLSRYLLNLLTRKLLSVHKLALNTDSKDAIRPHFRSLSGRIDFTLKIFSPQHTEISQSGTGHHFCKTDGRNEDSSSSIFHALFFLSLAVWF